jgi:hypothetical protein
MAYSTSCSLRRKDCDRIGFSRGIAVELYSVGAWFESRPGRRLSWLSFFVVFSSSLRQILGQYLC